MELQQRLQSQLSSGALNDFETQVLDDKWVTDAEWSQAKSLFTACMNEHGLEGSLGNGRRFQYGVTEDDQDKFAANYPPEDRSQALHDVMMLVDTCTQGTISTIGSYYFEPRNNPEGLSYEKAVRRCLSKTEFASDIAGMTDAEVVEFVYKATENYMNPELIPCTTGDYGDW